jgi:RNA polymerase sigma-70 factor (ECF subfamily)
MKSVGKINRKHKNKYFKRTGIKKDIQEDILETNGLLKHIIYGDAKAFEKLFKFYFQLLVNFCFPFVDDISVAENIVQEVFLKLWENRANLNQEIKIKFYLYRAVKNKVLNYLRHLDVVKKRTKDVYFFNYSLDKSEEQASNEKIIEIMNKTIEKLPEKRKIIFYMSKYENLKYLEIAQILNISVKTVENQMGRALKFLRKHLAKAL